MEQSPVVLTESHDLVLRRDPEVVLAEATKAAKALQRVVSTKAHKVVINGQQYLEFEDWQTVGRFYGMAARVVSTEPMEFGGAEGFEAVAEVVDVATGRVISRAEAMCLDDEERWKNRPLFQLRSMAQTRACAKAFRNCLAWVVVLAGYGATPAEEMITDARTSDKPKQAPRPQPPKPTREVKEQPKTEVKTEVDPAIERHQRMSQVAMKRWPLQPGETVAVLIGRWLEQKGYGKWADMSPEKQEEATAKMQEEAELA